MQITTRNATSEDLGDLLQLVCELAQYEKAPDEVWATLEDYERGFTNSDFESIVATDADGTILGAVIFYLTWSTWKGRMLYLEDFIVKKAARKQGIGAILFRAFLQRAKELDCRLVKWQVLDWNEPAIKFYKKMGATIEKEWWNGKIIFERGSIS